MSIKRLVEDDDNLAEAADVPDMEIQNQQGYKLEVLGQQLDGSNNTPPDDVIEKALGKIPPASQDIEKPKRPTALRDITLQIPPDIAEQSDPDCCPKGDEYCVNKDCPFGR